MRVDHPTVLQKAIFDEDVCPSSRAALSRTEDGVEDIGGAQGHQRFDLDRS